MNKMITILNKIKVPFIDMYDNLNNNLYHDNFGHLSISLNTLISI